MITMLIVFWAMMTCFSSLFYFRTLANNASRRKNVTRQSDLLQEYPEEKALGQLIAALDFPLAVIDCHLKIEAIREHFIWHRTEIELFCAINDISACFQNYFAVIGNFVGTEIVPGSRRNGSISKLYAADILFRKNGDNTLTLLSTFPRDKEHDFYIKDFALRLKEILK